jgi:hypothetical protein
MTATGAREQQTPLERVTSKPPVSRRRRRRSLLPRQTEEGERCSFPFPRLSSQKPISIIGRRRRERSRAGGLCARRKLHQRASFERGHATRRPPRERPPKSPPSSSSLGQHQFSLQRATSPSWFGHFLFSLPVSSSSFFGLHWRLKLISKCDYWPLSLFQFTSEGRSERCGISSLPLCYYSVKSCSENPPS